MSHNALFTGKSRLLATYFSGKICPLTPSQQPTNVEHLVEFCVPKSSNLNLKTSNGSHNQTEEKMKNKIGNDTTSASSNAASSEGLSLQKAKSETQNMAGNDDSSLGYCHIM